MAETLTEKIEFVAGTGTITTPKVNFLDTTPDTLLTCEKISFPLYAAYKVVAITIKCGTAITDTLKLRKIQ